MSALKSWYAGLNQREKSMVSILAVLMTLLLIYLLIIMPIKKYNQTLANEVDYYKAQLPLVEKKVAAVKGHNGSSRGNPNLSLNQMVTQTASSFGLKFSRIEEKVRNKEMTLRLDNIEFDQLLRWISMLEQDQGLIVSTLRISDTDSIGKVDASLKLIKTS